MRDRLTRRRMGSDVDPWTADDPTLNDLIRAYWSSDVDPQTWGDVRETLVDMEVDPDRWRPPVRARTATTLSFDGQGSAPVAFDLPADAALDDGSTGPIRVGNVRVVDADGVSVKMAGTVRVTPVGWAQVSADADFAAVTHLRIDPVQVQHPAVKFFPLRGTATYEVSTPAGDVRTVQLRVTGMLSASPALVTVMSGVNGPRPVQAAAKGLYGFPAAVEKVATAAGRRLAREATRIGKAAMGKDQAVVGFLQTHAKRDGNRAAKVLLAAIRDSMPRIAADMGMYGVKDRTARIGIQACADLRLAAGRIAADLHGRRASEYDRITSFMKTHAAKGKCAYSGMILSCYPDAPGTNVPPRLAFDD